MTYDNGNFYSGYFAFDKRSGRGVMRDERGLYEGEWKNHFRHGQGKQIEDSGCRIYEGAFAND